MKKRLQYLLVAIPATLLISNSAQAQEVSTKAADLVANASSAQNSNQSASEQYPFVIAQNADEVDENLPLTNYWYLSGSAGISFPNNLTATEKISGDKVSLGLDNAFQGTVAVGYQWSQARAELEVGHAGYGVNSVKALGISVPVSGDTSATTIMLNGYWDIPTKSKLRPYVGAGIGVGFHGSTKIKVAGVTTESSGDSALALQAKVGLQYEVTKKGNVFIEGKYQNIGGYSSGSGVDKIDYGSANNFGVSVGYRQGF
jgi:opacity protein-like surface antigen